MTTTLTLRDFNNRHPLTYLWVCGVSCPAGQDYNHVEYDSDEYDPDTADESDCDFSELAIIHKLWDLNGYVDEHGRWCVDDARLAKVRDEQGCSIFNVKAS